MKSIKIRFFVAIIVGLLASSTSLAGDLRVSVLNEKQEALDHAIVTLKPLFGAPVEPAPTPGAVMRQQNTMFQPFVLAVRTGTSVSFPNFDEFRHHVYSFSKAKSLELRLYGKDESNEILFDTAGVVALGCNIHDNMLAYIYVTDDPFYRVADNSGTVSFQGLANGKYTATVWHPDQKSKREVFTQEIEVTEKAVSVDVVLKMRSVRRRQKGADGKEYN